MKSNWGAREEDKNDREGRTMKPRTPLAGSNPAEMRTENRHYFHHCPGLDLWSVGKSRDEAEIKLKEEIHALLARCSKYEGPDIPRSARAYETYEMTS
jgi:hypothetical protein